MILLLFFPDFSLLLAFFADSKKKSRTGFFVISESPSIVRIAFLLCWFRTEIKNQLVRDFRVSFPVASRFFFMDLDFKQKSGTCLFVISESPSLLFVSVSSLRISNRKQEPARSRFQGHLPSLWLPIFCSLSILNRNQEPSLS